jgi:hypothetical protein
MSESDNLPAGGTDTAQPLTLEDAMAFDIYDPEEDTVADDAATQSQDKNGEADDDGQEPEEIDADAGEDLAEGEEQGETGEDEPEPGSEPADDVHVTVNGEKVALSALKAGYMRQADYSRKTQETAETRKNLEALSARVTSSVNVIADFLVKQIPPAPDPQLAMTNPGQFVQQKALHEAAVQQVNALLTQAGDVKGVVETLSGEQKRELLETENAKLAEVFPATTTKEGREKFFGTAATAAKSLGYSEDEIKQVADHRMFALAHYAAIGMQAEKAREKAKQKVHNAPPVAPQKARQQNTQQATVRRNQDAMKRLSRTGSIDDAMAIDFE